MNIEKIGEVECNGQLLAVRDALDVLNGKWKLPIIIALAHGKYRFKELHTLLGITPKMLSKELKDLEMHQLVKRSVYDSIPVSVSYSLTPYADSLRSVINSLHDWGKEHRKKVMTKENQ